MSYYDEPFMFRNLSVYLSLHHKISLFSHLANKSIDVHHLFRVHLFHQRIDGDEATRSSNASAKKKLSVISHSLLSYKEDWWGTQITGAAVWVLPILTIARKPKISQSELQTISGNFLNARKSCDCFASKAFAFCRTKARRKIRVRPIAKLSTDNCS